MVESIGYVVNIISDKMSNYHILENRAVIQISGIDASVFLQGLITNNITKVGSDKLVYAMMLSPQGRFLTDFFILKKEDGYLLDAAKFNLPDIVKRLNNYKLRAKVEINDVSLQYKVLASADKLDSLFFIDPRNKEMGYRKLSNDLIAVNIPNGFQELDWKIRAERSECTKTYMRTRGSEIFKNQILKGEGYNKPFDEYEQLRIKLRIPDAEADFIYDRSFPLEYGAVELNAIDFLKGCYVGQEVTARTYHLGVIRKKIMNLEIGAHVLPPRKGIEIMADGKKIGIVLGINNQCGLALVNTEDYNRSTEHELLADNISVKQA